MDLEDNKIKIVSVSETVESPVMQFRLKSNSKTIRKWLFNICHGNKPERPVSEFNIDLLYLQNSKRYITRLYGFDIGRIDYNNSYKRICFEPLEMYFEFPKDKYKSFSLAQMQEILKFGIQNFTSKQTFKYSFLSKANIRTSFNNEIIWNKSDTK